MDLAPLPGFRDFFPEERARRDYVFEQWRAAALRYGFCAYDGPPLEQTDLYRQKSGDEIVKQLYCFQDKGERDVSLRPEMTPTLARMVVRGGQSMPKPLKWFSMPQLFRYERQQKGRLREHYQFNCDIIGENSVEADVELVALLIDCLRSFRLTAEDFYVRVNDRQLLAALTQAIGIVDPELQGKVFGALDKFTRESPETIRSMLVAAGAVESQADQLLDLFKLKTLSEIAGRFDAHPAVCERVLHLQKFFGYIESMGLKDYAVFDITIVRGLAYYTGIVFEAFDRKGKFRAISGGGRYDHLLKKIGNVDLPAAGFGMGDVVLGEILTDRGLWPSKWSSGIDLYLVLVDESLRAPFLALAHELREQGWRADYSLSGGGVGKQFKAAGQRGARFAIVIGPEEWQRGAVKLKHLETREETEVRVDQLKSVLAEKLDSRFLGNDNKIGMQATIKS
ncbi:MAG: histidine--tRNA ligase [Verrucomicrobiae bacterium]|nr:histidine--tRNA ligase [Verrucomicrobiae bacterium]